MTSQEELPVPLNQLPMCWNDRRLLNYGPFEHVFQLRRDHALPSDNLWSTFVKNNVDEEFSRAFIRWCLIAFEPLFNEDPGAETGVQDFVKKPTFWDLFVEVFYVLSSDKDKNADQSALTLVNNTRRALGFKPFEAVSHTGILIPSEIVGTSSGHIHTSLNEGILKCAGEIEIASEIFMASVPRGPSLLSVYAEGRASRKKVHSRSPLEVLALEDKESAGETKAFQEQQKGKQKQRVGNKKNGWRLIETNGNKSSVRKDAKITVSGSDAKKRTSSYVHVDAEQTLVDNRRKSISTSRGHLGSQRKGDARDRKEQKPNPISAQSATLEEPLTKKQRLPDTGKWQQFAREHTPSIVAQHVDQSAYIIRNQGNGHSAATDMIPPNCFNGLAGNRGLECIEAPRMRSLLPCNQSEIGYQTLVSAVSITPPSASSGETLVDVENDVKVDPGKFTDRMQVENVECDALDKIRRERMTEAYNASRLQYHLPKAPLPKDRRPLMWAGSRQALCETTTWFRCYHGGVYFSDGKAHGYLLGGYSSQRDVFCWDGRLIISHGGGKSLEGSKGQQDQDVSVRSLLASYKSGYPLVLVADNKYALFPFDLGEKMYVVLGLYWIADAWAEKDVCESEGNFDTRIKYKFAFQYCEGQGPPWWLGRPSDALGNAIDATETAPSTQTGLGQITKVCFSDDQSQDLAEDLPPFTPGSSIIAPTHISRTTTKNICTRCDTRSPRAYKQGWMCLQPECAEFFCINSEEVFSLDYDDRFLELRPHPNFGNIDLSIPSPLSIPIDSADSIYSTRGFWCVKCGQLCPREKWECWECPGCGEQHGTGGPLPIRNHKEFWAQESDWKGYTVHKIYQGSGINVSIRKWGAPGSSESGLHYVFELPDSRGRIHLVSGNADVNDRANALFRQYQEDAGNRPFLRRYPLRSHHARGRMLTNYFSHNAGVPYEYAVTTNITDPFDKAPESVNGALQLIKGRASLVISANTDFNEILTAAYMAEQKMSYHTDDEKGLGPIVATLSLGSVAFMHFRLRRTSANNHPEKQLTLVLRHGDVLAMEGAAIQKLYEHSVIPMNFRIAATARYIAPNP